MKITNNRPVFIYFGNYFKSYLIVVGFFCYQSLSGQCLLNLRLHQTFVEFSSADAEAADLDNDNDIDLFILNPRGPDYILINNGLANFEIHQILPSGGGKTAELFDIDADGDLDLMIGLWTGNYEPSTLVEVYHNDGSGTFSFRQGYTGLGRISDLKSGDFDLDGDIDALAGCNTGDLLFLNNGAGSFIAKQAAQFIFLGNEPFVMTSSALVVEDFDGDHDLDYFAVGNRAFFYGYSLVTRTFINDGHGKFSVLDNSQFLREELFDLSVGDIDNDGDNDVVGTIYLLGTFLYRNNGVGTMTRQPLYLPFGETIELEDLNQDGWKDILIARGWNSNLIYLNDKSGNFNLKYNFDFDPQGAEYREMVMADFNSDGFNDLFNLNWDHDRVWLFLPIDNDGDAVCDEEDNCVQFSNPGQEDYDQDGIGDVCDIDDDGDGFTDDEDCDDFNPFINPGSTENCNGIDDDCDGLIDDLDPSIVGQSAWYADLDGDGFGNPNVIIYNCLRHFGYVGNSLDCDDTSQEINPSRAEICNNRDDDCNGAIDDVLELGAGDTDLDGFCGDEDNCPELYNPQQEDSDCDGIGDVCDQCPGGNDRQDKDNDGIPDCKDQGGIQDLPAEWVCDKNYKKVLVCHRSPDNPEHFETLCLSFVAVAEHLAHGDYLGPCAVSTCSNNANGWSSPSTSVQNMTNAVTIYPNPNRNRLLTLLFSAPVDKEGYLYIQDIYGKTLQDMSIRVGQMNLSVPLAFATPGIYFISVQIGDRMAYKQKVVVVD